ncbi:hypothetical protein [Anabaena sp. CA = ATCC 33047]|uniref:hypothetical protein n=1 Tax=Anabaena sp. (strain CA / ATCC 33047) TaxID=52271 RepID=UPI00082C1B4D|nr:hypothetical protein [Anabaena sp. CA = ATCC 33047]
MNNFHFKSLIFYALATGSVLILFNTVTVYGEDNLQAPPVINGSYRVILGKNSPKCQTSAPLRLNLHQSGIYFNASLSSANIKVDSPQQYSLKGIFKNQQLTLAGKLDQTILCDFAPPHKIQAQMQLVDTDRLQGKILVSTIPQTLEFNATPETAQAKPQNGNK